MTLCQYNMLDAFVSMLVAFLALGLLLHKVLWPIAGRVINALYENEVFKNKKLLLGVAVPLLVIAVPQSAHLLELFKKVGSE